MAAAVAPSHPVQPAGMSRIVWTAARLLGLFTELAAVAPNYPQVAAHGQGQAAYQALCDTLRRREEWAAEAHRLTWDKVRDKLKTTISAMLAGKFDPPSGFGPEEMKFCLNICQKVQEAMTRKETTRGAEKDHDSYKDFLKRISEKWMLLGSSGTLEPKRWRLANAWLGYLNAAARPPPSATGEWPLPAALQLDSSGKPVVMDPSGLQEAPNIASREVLSTGEDVAPSSSAAESVSPNMRPSSAVSLDSDESAGEHAAKIPRRSRGNAPCKKKHSLPCSSSGYHAAAAGKPPMPSFFETPEFRNLLKGDAVDARSGCRADGCQCGFTRVELGQEGVMLSGDCPACQHPRMLH